MYSNSYYSETYQDSDGNDVVTTYNDKHDQLAKTPMKDLKNKIMLFVTLNDVNTDAFNSSKLSKVTDIVNIKGYRENEIMDEEKLNLIDDHKQRLGIVYPSLESSNNNYNCISQCHAVFNL